jgi:hypothetical protein
LSSHQPIKPVSDINTDQLLEVITYYHRFYDEEEEDLAKGISNIQNFLNDNRLQKIEHELYEDTHIEIIYPFWDETQPKFNEYIQKINKAIAVIPQVVNDIRKELYPYEQLDSLINVPKGNPPPEPKGNFLGISNPFKKKNHDANSPYRLSIKKTKFLESIEEKWIQINEYQTKGHSTWSRLILDVGGQKMYRDLYLDFFNYYIAVPLSAVFHYGLWLNLANEKNLSRDIMMVGMQQTLRKDDEFKQQKPALPDQPKI